MTVFRVGDNRELRVSAPELAEMGIEAGEWVTIQAMDDFPETDEPIGPETRAGLEQARREIEAGDLRGPFKTAEEVQA